MIRVGTRDWRHAWSLYDGLPYVRRFRRYTELFDTVEVPTTYNRVPSWRTVSRWRAKAPRGFTYSFVAPKHLTYCPSGEERRALRRFLRRHRALGEARGAVRFVLPKGLKPTAFQEWLRLLKALEIPGAYAFETENPALQTLVLEAGYAVVNLPEGPFLYLVDFPPPLPAGEGYAYYTRPEDALQAKETQRR